MDGDIDVAAVKRDIELLGEEALAAGFTQRPILDRVAGRLDGDDLETSRCDTMACREAALDLMGLRQRQWAAARTDPEPWLVVER